MGFANLKKRSPSVSPRQVSIDEFIDDAVHYANGHSRVVGFYANPEPQSPYEDDSKNAIHVEEHVLRRATFTLSEEAIRQLSHLSQQTGIARSRLLRIWLSEQQNGHDLTRYLLSKVR